MTKMALEVTGDSAAGRSAAVPPAWDIFRYSVLYGCAYWLGIHLRLSAGFPTFTICGRPEYFIFKSIGSRPYEFSMLNTKILNPHLLSLLARVRHTNAIVIADRGFPFWPQIETVDVSVTDDLPTVLQVLAAVRSDFHAAQAFMAREFIKHNSAATRKLFATGLRGVPTTYEPHVKFKQRVPGAIGLIRTGDTIQYANMILISG
jgi:D-ribose pyranase